MLLVSGSYIRFLTKAHANSDLHLSISNFYFHSCSRPHKTKKLSWVLLSSSRSSLEFSTLASLHCLPGCRFSATVGTTEYLEKVYGRDVNNRTLNNKAKGRQSYTVRSQFKRFHFKQNFKFDKYSLEAFYLHDISKFRKIKIILVLIVLNFECKWHIYFDNLQLLDMYICLKRQAMMHTVSLDVNK